MKETHIKTIIIGAITFKNENITDKKSIAIIPKKISKTINTFFNIFTPFTYGDYTTSSTVLQYSVFT